MPDLYENLFPKDLGIWDLHAHLLGVDGATPDQRMAKMVEVADRMNIERFCVYMGMTWARDPDPAALRQQNDDVLEALTHWHHRAFGFVYLNGKHLDASLAELERCVANGPMTGVKLWISHKCNTPEVATIIRRAAELKAVIYQHTWIKAGENYPGESTSADLAELADAHPDIPLICGHTGGDWERGIAAIRKHENVSIGIGGSDPTAEFVETAVRELGAKRVIYGSDIGGRSFASQLAKVLGAKISDEDKRLILRDNLRKLMLPILNKKGMKA